MARTLTQRAVGACGAVLTRMPQGAPVDVPALVRGSGVGAAVPLVQLRLRQGHWIASDGHGGWVRGGRRLPAARPARAVDAFAAAAGSRAAAWNQRVGRAAARPAGALASAVGAGDPARN